MTNHPSEQTLEHLLTLGILRRNAASLQEIERRHIVANVNLSKDGSPVRTIVEFLRDELNAAVEDDDEPWETDGSPDQPQPADPICQKARAMLADGYTGQNMDDPDNAELYINMAAENENVSRELPEKGVLFWKSADFNYRKWKVQRRLREKKQ